MDYNFSRVLAALIKNNNIAVDDHLLHTRQPEQYEKKVVVIASLNNNAVFLEEFSPAFDVLSVNIMGVDDQGVVHITKSSCAVLRKTAPTLNEAVETYNSFAILDGNKIKCLTYLPHCFASTQIGEATVALNRDTDGLYKVETFVETEGHSVTFHEELQAAIKAFKRSVDSLLSRY